MKRILFFLCWIVNTLIVSAQKAPNQFAPYKQKIPGSEISFKLVPIPAGKYTIGSAIDEKKRQKNEGPQKEISISAFWMGAFEVTRDELNIFLNDPAISQNVQADAITRPSAQYVDLTWGMGKEGGYPANSMSQRTALMYCKWLYQKTKIFYRLPTEAEWEYACRAGTSSTYFFGNDPTALGQYAWYSKNSPDKYQKVGLKKPNPWGLYDILGNIMEWTLDHYYPESYNQLNSKDPFAPYNKSKYPKVLRGGSYENNAAELRSARRFYSDPSWNIRDPQIPKSKWWLTEAKDVGFRLVRPLQQPSEAAVESFFNTYLN